MGGNASCCEKACKTETHRVVGCPVLDVEMVEAIPEEKDHEDQIVTPSEQCSQDSSPAAAASFKMLLRSMSFPALDTEIARGVSLSATLRRMGRLWMVSPLDMEEEERKQLFNISFPVKSYDVFLSHTWRNKGRWKVCSLLMQCGWWIFGLVWFLAVATAMLLCVSGVLPMPLRRRADTMGFDAECPFGPWVFIANLLAFVVTPIVVPYLPESLFPTCFLDVACISQVDEDLKQRGVYGLGGSLSVAKELRILWGPSYLSRLWCVFELAAYRKANPDGKIRLAPLFVERQVFLLILGSNVVSLLLWFSIGFNIPFGSAASIVVLSPIFFVLHANRRNMAEKQQLLSDLEHFDLNDVDCRLESDRKLVLATIRDWYGSEQAFMEEVRGPLRKELLNSSSNSLPLSYGLLIVAAPLSVALEDIVAYLMASAPLESLLGELCSTYSLGSVFILISFQLAWWLCDITSATRSSKLVDYAVTALICLGWFVFSIFGFIIDRFTSKSNLWAGLAWVCVNFLVVCQSHILLCRRSKRSTQ